MTTLGILVRMAKLLEDNSKKKKEKVKSYKMILFNFLNKGSRDMLQSVPEESKKQTLYRSVILTFQMDVKLDFLQRRRALPPLKRIYSHVYR